MVTADTSGAGPPPVRPLALPVLDDVLGDVHGGRPGQLQEAMEMIAEEGRVVVVLLREPNRATLSDSLRERLGEPRHEERLVDYGVGAQILLDLGVGDMVLLSNTEKHIIGLDGYGLKVVERRAIKSGEE
jgi:3,4-dihydroxy 2-butanone 4-phosphate synthase/GTP cyclohydrolase II